MENTELWLFGDGDSREVIEKLCQQDDRIKYKGIRSLDEIVQFEQRVALLINPRSSTPSFTKYSFPSKTIEYMSSGTPMLTTRLPGIPEEYFQYLYCIHQEDADGIAAALMNVLSQDIQKRSSKGKEARRFVLENKSCSVQAKRIITHIEKVLHNEKQ